MKLHFVRFDTEKTHDKVRVYDGNDATAQDLYNFSGRYRRPSDLVSSGNTIFVSFVTGRYTTNGGFKIVYSTSVPVPGKTSVFCYILKNVVIRSTYTTCPIH